jgi:predicted enzyme related to lactoylglutathione lyase
MAEGKYTHGRVVWRELLTNDVDKARAFYSELLNWKIEPGMDMGPGGTYFMISANGKQIGGMMKSPSELKSASFWMSVVSVADVDATVAAATKNGGKTLNPLVDMPSVGRYATIADADGAALSLLKSATGDAAATMRPSAGEFAWETLNTADEARAKKFYTSVLGWKTMAGPGGAGTVFTTDGGREGQVADMQKAQGFPPSWLTYVVVDKLEPSRDRVAKLGGKVMMPLIEVPTVGRIAVITDPTGGAIGLFQPQMG